MLQRNKIKTNLSSDSLSYFSWSTVAEASISIRGRQLTDPLSPAAFWLQYIYLTLRLSRLDQGHGGQVFHSMTSAVKSKLSGQGDLDHQAVRLGYPFS